MRRLIAGTAALFLFAGCTKESNLIPVASLSGPASVRIATPTNFDGSASGDADGHIATWAFDFGDGSAPVSGTGSVVSHTFATAGSYKVVLTVTDDKGATAVAQRDVTVTANSSPVAMISAPASGRINRSIAVSAAGSLDSDGTLASYSFEFGDQSAAVTGVTSAIHVYPLPGIYTIAVTVTDNDGATSVASVQISIADNIAPLASFSSASSSIVGQSASFDSSATTDTDGTIASRSWDFGDTGTSTLVAPVHTYLTAGTKTVTLTVTDNEAKTATSSRQIMVVTGAQANSAPTANFSSPASVRVSTAAFFDATGSTAPGATSVSYAWNFGDAGTGASSAVGHTYATAGTYVVSLTITATYADTSTNTNTATRSITVTANQAPSATFTAPASARFATTVAFDASASRDADGTIATYRFDFGDASSPVIGSSPVVTHAYAAAGTYAVTLTVLDNDGAIGTATRSILINPNAAPLASVVASAGGRINRSLLIDASGSRDPDGTIANYLYAFGDGSPIVSTAAASVSHTWTTAGSFTLQVTVTDNDGAMATAVRTVIIDGNRAPVASFFGPTEVVVNVVSTFDASGSFDPDGSIVSYSWNFGDGTPLASGISVNHAWASATACGGTNLCVVTLTVTDNEPASNTLTAVTSRQVTVFTAAQAGAGPVAQLNAPAQTTPNTLVDFIGTGSNGGSGNITTYAFDFGDGSPVVSGLSSVVSHSYAATGTWVAKLTVTSAYSDGSTRTNTAQQTVSVIQRQVIISSISPPTGSRDGGTTVLITGVGFVDAGSTRVFFGGSQATILAVLDPTQAKVLTPSGDPGPVNVTVITPNGAAVSVGGFSYLGGANQADTSFCWQDATVPAGGTSVGFAPNDDDVNLGNAATALPFDFNYFGSAFPVGSRLRVTSNGWLSFTNVSAVFNHFGLTFPTFGLPENIVSPFFSDQNISTGAVTTRTTGVPPNRQFSVEWNGVRENASGDLYHYEASLFEGSRDIKIQYRNPNIYTGSSAGQNALIGVQGADGINGLTFASNASNSGLAPGGRSIVLQQRGGGYFGLTDTTLNVSQSNPPGTRIANGGSLFALLSKSLNPTSVSGASVFVTDTTTASTVPINTTVFGTNPGVKDGLFVQLAGPVTASHAYTLTVTPGVKDGLGNALSQDPMGSGSCPTAAASSFVLPFNATFSQAFRVNIGGGGSNPKGITATADNARVFVGRFGDNRVTEMSVTGRSVISTTNLPAGASAPVGILTTGSVDRLAIADNGSAQVTKFDITASPATGTNTTTGAAASPFGITQNLSVTPTRLYIASEDNRIVSLTVPAAGAYTACAIGPAAVNELTLTGGGTARAIAMRSGATQYYVANSTRFFVINANACGSATGDTIASNVAYGGTGSAYAMVTTATREYVSMENQNRVAIFDTTGAPVGTIPLPGAPRGMAISPDGLTLLVALTGLDAIAEISLATNSVVDVPLVTPGCSPDGITTLTTAGIQQAWVSCGNSGDVIILQ